MIVGSSVALSATLQQQVLLVAWVRSSPDTAVQCKADSCLERVSPRQSQFVRLGGCLDICIYGAACTHAAPLEYLVQLSICGHSIVCSKS